RAASSATARASAASGVDSDAAEDPVDDGLDPLVVDPLHCGAEDGLGLPVLQILLDGLPAVIQVVDDAGPDGHRYVVDPLPQEAKEDGLERLDVEVFHRPFHNGVEDRPADVVPGADELGESAQELSRSAPVSGA